MITIRQIETTVVLHEEVEEDRDEEGSGERVGRDCVKGDVGGCEEGHAFGYAKSGSRVKLQRDEAKRCHVDLLIGDLRMYLG